MMPRLHHVDIFAVLGIETVGRAFLLQQLADHERAVLAGILHDQARRSLERPAHDADADVLVVVLTLDLVQGTAGIEERHAAAGDDTFLHRSAGWS